MGISDGSSSLAVEKSTELFLKLWNSELSRLQQF